MNRARLIACATRRCSRAVTPVLRRLCIFPFGLMYRRSESTSFQSTYSVPFEERFATFAGCGGPNL